MKYATTYLQRINNSIFCFDKVNFDIPNIFLTSFKFQRMKVIRIQLFLTHLILMAAHMHGQHKHSKKC